MLSLVELYQRVNDLDKIDENGFVAAENRKELFANIKFEEDSIRKVWGVDQRQLNGLLYKLKIQCLDYDPRIVDAEKLFSRIDSQDIFKKPRSDKCKGLDQYNKLYKEYALVCYYM